MLAKSGNHYHVSNVLPDFCEVIVEKDRKIVQSISMVCRISFSLFFFSMHITRRRWLFWVCKYATNTHITAYRWVW